MECWDRGIIRNFEQSERDGGVHIDDIAVGACLRIRTTDHTAILVKCAESEFLIWEHPVFYPIPTPVCIVGSNWGGMILKHRFIGIGMSMEFVRTNWKPNIRRRIHHSLSKFFRGKRYGFARAAFRTVGDYLGDGRGIRTARILAIEEIIPATA